MMYNPQLDTFLCVAESGSFNKAAEKLYISPPAVIKQINLLEESLGVKLFDRSHRGLTLTKAGRSIRQSRHRRYSAFWMQPKSSAKSCTTDYNLKVYTDERSETSLEVSLFL